MRLALAVEGLQDRVLRRQGRGITGEAFRTPDAAQRFSGALLIRGLSILERSLSSLHMGPGFAAQRCAASGTTKALALHLTRFLSPH
jgi:hypothetical protein